jgi:hypothetical protein
MDESRKHCLFFIGTGRTVGPASPLQIRVNIVSLRPWALLDCKFMFDQQDRQFGGCPNPECGIESILPP